MLNRRRFVTGCIGTVAGGLVFSHSAGACASGPEVDAVREIGAWYLERFPEHKQATRLLATLEQRLPGIMASHHSASLALGRAAVRSACVADLEAGDTVYVGGWLLAGTEARLCALAVLAETSA